MPPREYLTGTGPGVIITDEHGRPANGSPEEEWADDVESSDGPSAEFDNLVSRYATSIRARREATRIVDSESWTPPDPGRSLAESREKPPSPVRHVIDGLLPEGISILAAQFKAGKTTLGIDLSACLVSAQKFLDHFEVDNLSGNVGYWNLEVDEPQMYQWQNRRIRKGADRIFTAHLRGRRIDLLHEATAEWAIDWLRKWETEAWIIDPLGRLLDAENDPAEFSRWFRVLEMIVAEAGVRAVLIMHHSGHAAMGQADSVPRARGASSMLGNTDANIGYRHGGDLGAMPPDSRRYLSALGRGVEVWPELTLDYEYTTGRLYAIENAPGRNADKLSRLADKAVSAVAQAGDWNLNNGELKEAIGGNAADRSKAISAALREGRIISRSEGKGKQTFYALAPSETEKIRIT
jgi:hypothetical protein